MPRQNQLYAAKWEQFTHLDHTQDTLADERRGWRRWLALPYIAFILPIDDPDVIAQLTAWQTPFLPWMRYDPQPARGFHITVHLVGRLRHKPWFWLPHTWRAAALPALAGRVQAPVTTCSPLELRIGPLNAFPNVLIAEAQDEGQCLRTLRTHLRRALPLRARPPSRWAYLPHITLGYWGRQPAAPLAAQLAAFRQVEPITLRVTRLVMTVYTLGAGPLRPDALHTAREDIIAEYVLQG